MKGHCRLRPKLPYMASHLGAQDIAAHYNTYSAPFQSLWSLLQTRLLIFDTLVSGLPHCCLHSACAQPSTRALAQ